nr:MAG TPA: RNA-dependent RNA polymerase [Riboviria sp.]
MQVLNRIPQDCTNDQGKFINLVQDKDIYYSIDLSNATDRFPIELIGKLLASKFPSSYVEAWKRVMVGHPFTITIDGEVKEISYSVGNPMGAYSSFNSFALTHHYLIYYICRKLRKSWKTLPYALLGDDIVICDEEVAEMYMTILTDLGVEYSKAKTHKSKDFYEFAKRIFYQGVEVSPFPVSALKECGKSYDLLTTLV